MKKALLLFGFFAMSTVGFSQRTCATMSNLEQLKAADPTLETRMLQIENQTRDFLKSNSSLQTAGTAAVVNIPVVVHVVYNTAAQNISDAQIQSQIAVLNEDFRRLNADKVNTPSAFATTAADAEITFCLASKSPTGAATTGIVRKSTTVTAFSDNNAVKYSSQGGDDAWPSSSYLNLWVCNLGGGLLGYAQFPGGPAATDGVVILYTSFGRGYATTAPYNKGRTATHEVGHWLNLRHIWGDASCGDDLVSDTPTQSTSNYSCPTFPHKTCGNTTNGDEFMNYMDYTDDGCMNMFSLGQKTRMKALFAAGGSKASLLSSSGCGGTTPTTPVYCSAKGTNTSYEWISNVKLGTINNTSGANAGYGDFTSISTNLTIGSANTITLTPAFSGSAYSEYFKVWIDYNKDKDFDDVGELVYTSAGVTAAVSGSFTVPSVTATGSTRMRVIMKDGAISTPCEQYTYGEAEDYTVNFVSGTTPTTPTSTTLTIGAGTGTTAIGPYGTYYMDERSQFIITKAELAAAGYTSANSFIRSMAFNVYTASSQVMNAFTIKIGHTTATAFVSSSFMNPVMTTVYSGNVTAVAGWNTHTFTSAFAYNGTDNIIVDICWNNSSYTTDTKVYYTATADNKTLYYKADVAAGGACSNTTGTLTTSRPNVRMVFKSASTGRIEEQVSGEITNNLNLQLYPNPAATDLNIAYTLETESNVAVRLYNAIGVVVADYMQGTQKEGDYTLNVNLASNGALSSGIYFCTINVNGVLTTKRFIVSK
jgi:hypothetical protein